MCICEVFYSPKQSVWWAKVPSGQRLRHLPLCSWKPALHLVQKSRLKQCSQSRERHSERRETVQHQVSQEFIQEETVPFYFSYESEM